MADLGWEAPRLEYIDVDLTGLLPSRRFNRLIPVVLCPRCRTRYAEDRTRDHMGNPRPEGDLAETDRAPRCEECVWEELGEAFERDTLNTIERKLGLTEENKKTLEALMRIIDNPDRVMMVARVQDRVDELERRLEDRTESLRDTVESKMENANSRLFVSSLITNAALFLAGLLVGVVAVLLSGG